MTNKVKLNNQDVVFDVEDNETVLEAALRQGHNLPYGCRNGACGSYAGQPVDGLSPEEVTQGYALLCQARAKSDLAIDARTVETAADIKLKQLPCRVTLCEKLNDDVIRLVLDLPRTERLQFLAGQYIHIIMREGKRRAFSLANPPHLDQSLELHIRHYDGGLFSEYAFNDLKEKTILRIEGPLGQFTLHESDRPILMLAGGTGFAPIKSLVEHAIESGEQRPITFYWGARTESDLYMHDMAEQWAKENDQIKYIPVLSDVDHLNGWEGKTGFVHEAVMEDYADLSGYDIYACGPPPMIQAVVNTFPEHGMKRERLFSDSFEFAAD